MRVALARWRRPEIAICSNAAPASAEWREATIRRGGKSEGQCIRDLGMDERGGKRAGSTSVVLPALRVAKDEGARPRRAPPEQRSPARVSCAQPSKEFHSWSIWSRDETLRDISASPSTIPAGSSQRLPLSSLLRRSHTA